jgi:hypothetical protein
MFEKELPMSFMDLQFHLLIHLPDEVELSGVLSCCWIFFLEREVHEKIEGVCSTKGKTKWIYGKEVHIMRVVLLCQ